VRIYYDPSLGRFVSRDPLPGFIGNPRSVNRYGYALNNPTTLSDPSGLAAPGGSWGPGVGTKGKSKVMDCGADLHGAFDVGGVINPLADAFNGLLYLCEGNLGDAVVSGLSIIPIADLLKLLRNAIKAGKAASIAERLSHLGPDVIRQVDDAIQRAASGSPARFPGHDGKVFLNSCQLPQAPSGHYKEWTAAASGEKRGMHRVIIGGDPSAPDAIWYWDHVTEPIQIYP
jgi:hypothetical protein